MTLVKRSSWRRQPWKNGRGITHEIWRWSAATGVDAEDFDLRLSVAEIDGAQPFSQFPEHYRTLVPLEDSTLTLAGSPMVKHRALHFPGDVPMETRGQGRAIDLNVMSRIDARAQVEISARETYRESPAIWPATRARHLAVFALAPTRLRDELGGQTSLDSYDTLVHLEPVAYTADTPVVWIRFGP